MRRRDDFTGLQTIALFRGLSPATLAILNEGATWHEYRAGEQIIGYLDTCDDVFVLVLGKARVIIYANNGKAVGFRQIGPGDVFGEYSAVDKKPRSASVEAIAKCRILRMSEAHFWRLVHDEPEFRTAMLRHFVTQLRSLTGRIYEFSTLAVQNRIHAEIVRMAAGAGESGGRIVVAPAPTNAEIAIRISTHREAVSRELARLSRKGLVHRKGKTIVIEDLGQLQQLVETMALE